jgi:hypothetical protein
MPETQLIAGVNPLISEMRLLMGAMHTYEKGRVNYSVNIFWSFAFTALDHSGRDTYLSSLGT